MGLWNPTATSNGFPIDSPTQTIMLKPRVLLTHLKENGLSSFEGTRIDAEIPISEALLNKVATQQARSAENLESLYLHLPGNNGLVIEAKAKVSAKLFGFKVPVNRKIYFQLEREVILSPSPTIRLRLVEGLSGLEKTILHWMENLISKMVPGEISLSKDTLSIDLGPEIRKEGLEFLVSNLRKVTVEGQSGKLLIKIRGSV
jgi:hypothetical protein